MAYQVPRSDHPWRQYPNRRGSFEAEDRNVKPLEVFIKEITASWENVTVTTSCYNKVGDFKLRELPDSKKALWLIGILKRNYV